MSPALFFEDFVVGKSVSLGSRRVTREEIIAFASEFDPQPEHLDEVAARGTGGLAASGWHVCALHMRLMCDFYLIDSSSLGSPGLDRVEWFEPVRPGDVLTSRYTVLEARGSTSRPEVGICRFLYETFNQRGELVMQWDCTQFFGTRERAGAA